MKKIICFSAFFFAYLSIFACTNLIVGKGASADGSTIISYAADSYSLYGYLHFSPATDHPEGAMREVKDWDTGKPLCKIPQVKHTFSVVGNMNEHQLTIGETTWEGRKELIDTITLGIDYGSLIYIALERSKTAREAIKCMTELVEKYGYSSSGETFTIADPNEIWIMDMVGKGPGKKGAVWVATRVPDDCICAHANQARITKIDFNDTANWKWHKDIVKFAKKQGYFEGEDKDFDFVKAYNPPDFSALFACEARVWSFFNHFSDEMDKYADYAFGKTFLETGDAGEPMPLFIRPNRKVSVEDIKKCMRDQYDSTEWDITQKLAAGPWHSKLRYGSLKFTYDSTVYWFERPIATQQTAWSYVAQMRGNVDSTLGGILWFGVDDAASSLYVPIYSCLKQVPNCFKYGNGDLYTYSPTSAFWIYNTVANWAYSKYSVMMQDIRQKQNEWENKFALGIELVEASVKGLEKAQAEKILSDFSILQAETSTQAWKELSTYLLVKYLDGQQRKEENGQFLRNPYGEPVGPHRPAYPDEFLQQIISETSHE